MRIKGILLLLGLGILGTARAQTPSKPWSLNWNTRYQTSLHASSDFRKRGSVVSTLAGNYLFSDVFRLQGVVGGIQALQPALDFRVINPEFRGFWLVNPANQRFKIYLGPTLVLPFGSDAKDESLIVGAGAGARFLWNAANPDGSGFRAFYDLTFSKSFHQFQTSVFSQVNTEIALNHLIYLEYGFDAQWSVNTSVGFSSFWSYFGVISNNYSVEQELDFQLNPLLTVYLSHVRGGDFLSPNGQNYSFNIFDSDASRLSLGFVLSFF